MSVGADRISYIGGLDWQYSLQELGRSVEEEGYSLDDDITEEEFERVR